MFSDHYVCVTSKKSAFSNRKLNLQEIASIPQIAVSPFLPKHTGSVDDWFREAGLTPNVVISAPCFTVVPAYLEMADVIAFLPSRSISNNSLKVLDLHHHPVNFEVVASWHARSDQDPLNRWVVDLIREKYQELR